MTTMVVHYKNSQIIITRHGPNDYSYAVPGSRIEGTGQRSAEEAQADAERMIDEADRRASDTIKRTLRQ